MGRWCRRVNCEDERMCDAVYTSRFRRLGCRKMINLNDTEQDEPLNLTRILQGRRLVRGFVHTPIWRSSPDFTHHGAWAQ